MKIDLVKLCNQLLEEKKKRKKRKKNSSKYYGWSYIGYGYPGVYNNVGDGSSGEAGGGGE